MSHVGLAPRLLPITGTFVLPFTAYLFALTSRIVVTRLSTKQFMGDKLDADKRAASDDATAPDPLFLNTRCHQNFLENVPLTFILLATAELNGGDPQILSYVMGAFFACRVAHVEFGLLAKNSAGLGRILGFYGTLAVQAGLSVYSAMLVKGYWGF